MSAGIFILLILIFQSFAFLIHRLKPALNKRVFIPFDLIIMRGLEIYKAIPALFVLLAVLSIIREERILNIVLLIGVLSWPSVTRYLRAELLKIRELNYIKSAKVLGFSNWSILIRHAIPNAIGPVLVVLSFGMASAVLLEASLSFLGIGLPADEVSWGSMLSEGRLYMKAWWLSFFPGLAIFFVLYTFNRLGDRLLRKD
jgi:peptide/nickel transport system permease protein